MPFLPPSQQRQSTEGIIKALKPQQIRLKSEQIPVKTVAKWDGIFSI